MSDKVAVARLDELVEGRGRCVKAHGRAIALFKVQGRVYAIDDICPHRGGPLSDGDLERNNAVSCPLHGWAFELATGAMCGNPGLKVPIYEVEIRGEDILVGPPQFPPRPF